MTIIKNINSAYGDPVEFYGKTLDMALFDMANHIVMCGYANEETHKAVAQSLREDTDYEIVKG
jgi:hypothetical protein